MAVINPSANGYSRSWELASTAIGSATFSDTAGGGIHNKLATAYIITSGVVSMTLKLWESPDNSNWVEIDEIAITANIAWRIQQPFRYLRIEVSSWASGQIDSIIVDGLVD